MRVSFTECGVTVAASSLKGHMERQHGRIIPQIMEVEIKGGTSELFYFLPPGAEDGEMPGDRMSGSSA